jgi:hypothetical protein
MKEKEQPMNIPADVRSLATKVLIGFGAIAWIAMTTGSHDAPTPPAPPSPPASASIENPTMAARVYMDVCDDSNERTTNALVATFYTSKWHLSEQERNLAPAYVRAKFGDVWQDANIQVAFCAEIRPVIDQMVADWNTFAQLNERSKTPVVQQAAEATAAAEAARHERQEEEAKRQAKAVSKEAKPMPSATAQSSKPSSAPNWMIDTTGAVMMIDEVWGCVRFEESVAVRQLEAADKWVQIWHFADRRPKVDWDGIRGAFPACSQLKPGDKVRPVKRSGDGAQVCMEYVPKYLLGPPKALPCWWIPATARTVTL